MDLEALPDFLLPPLLALTVFAGVLLMAGATLQARVRHLLDGMLPGSDELKCCRRQLQQAVEAGGLAPFVWDARSREFAGPPTLPQLLEAGGLEAWGRLGGSGFHVRRIHREDRGAWIAALRRVRRTGRLDHRVRYVRRDGGILHVVVRAELEFDRRGEPTRLVGICRELAGEGGGRRRPPERMSELPHLGEMAAALGHELRQPRMAIQYSARTAQSYLAALPTTRAKVAELVTDITRQCEQAEAIIHRVHARTRSERVPLQPVCLNAIVRETLRDLQASAALGGAEVALELGAGLPAVQGDAVQLRQVLTNLATNAAEAMSGLPRRDRRLVIRTHAADPDEVQLTVSDNGPGLSREVGEKLFLPFVTSKPGGLGLGLCICRSIVAAHDGSISGENKADGPGACFQVSLPAWEWAASHPADLDEAHAHHLRG